jgi:hypothetical protein
MYGQLAPTMIWRNGATFKTEIVFRRQDYPERLGVDLAAFSARRSRRNHQYLCPERFLSQTLGRIIGPYCDFPVKEARPPFLKGRRCGAFRLNCKVLA